MIVSVREIYEVLAQFKALLVHFSGAPKGHGVQRPNHLFPNDLRHVLSGKAQGGLSCSTVKPGDCFCGYNRNAIGCIGVILGFNSTNSVVAVSESDCGSFEGKNGQRIVKSKQQINLEDILNSIQKRPSGQYNEWIMKNYITLGIFAVHPYEISSCGKLSCPDPVLNGLWDGSSTPVIKKIDLQTVSDQFPGFPIYTFDTNNIFHFNNGKCQQVNHDKIYHIDK